MDIPADRVMALRKRSGAPMMDCKKALAEAEGDEGKALEILRKKGLQSADQKASREVKEGVIFHYIHHDSKLGVLAEVACETDFVGRNEMFQAFGRDLCLHIAAMRPRFLNRDAVSEADIEKERVFLTEQAAEQMAGRPQDVIDKAVEGRMKKFFSEHCLMDQPWVKDDKKTVEQVRVDLVGHIGENIQVRRFVRMQLGE
ncbi:MAG: elongation factor Ts [Planctomycetes bacterium]|nr:elongation factor Ts [Planctomycetota bacterium]MCB9888818.1 elongation factor Ts [Planctomycetota bacterium]